ncbi:hypothetical protein HKBW3S09_01448, partial [Candidatus Hakubella thermalkaliphila]
VANHDMTGGYPEEQVPNHEALLAVIHPPVRAELNLVITEFFVVILAPLCTTKLGHL